MELIFRLGANGLALTLAINNSCSYGTAMNNSTLVCRNCAGMIVGDNKLCC